MSGIESSGVRLFDCVFVVVVVVVDWEDVVRGFFVREASWTR